jgi:hypothetical protein
MSENEKPSKESDILDKIYAQALEKNANANPLFRIPKTSKNQTTLSSSNPNMTVTAASKSNLNISSKNPSEASNKATAAAGKSNLNISSKNPSEASNKVTAAASKSNLSISSKNPSEATNKATATSPSNISVQSEKGSKVLDEQEDVGKAKTSNESKEVKSTSNKENKVSI